SYIGFQTQEVEVAGKTGLEIVMISDSQTLDEVVVVGYGEQKESRLVSSVSTIGTNELRVKQSKLKNNRAGQIAGIISVQRSGEPGNDAGEFFIRGQSSYAGGTNPLVLVDGVPRNMNDIDVEEVESFTVLKDASATAV